MLKSIVVLLAVAVGSFGGRAVAGDSVTGDGTFRCGGQLECPTMRVRVQATSGASGESPSGTLSYGTAGPYGGGNVVRLCVTGNTAVVFAHDPSPGAYMPYVSATIVDNAGTGNPDTMELGGSTTAPTSCAPLDNFYGPHVVEVGDFIVDDQVACVCRPNWRWPWAAFTCLGALVNRANALVQQGIFTQAEASAWVRGCAGL